MASLDPGGHSSRFRWLTAGRIPARLDLRLCGWTLETKNAHSREAIGVIDASGFDENAWMRIFASIVPEARRLIAIVGVPSAVQRTSLLKLGFGDALPADIDVEEFAARATRIAEFTRWLPRYRRLGCMELDLIDRQAYGLGKPMDVNPREFSLLWRLADDCGRAVSKEDLIRDVWRMGFVPETNSVAVHMSRLRRKLAAVGLDGVLQTVPEGGYRLAIIDEERIAASTVSVTAFPGSPQVQGAVSSAT